MCDQHWTDDDIPEAARTKRAEADAAAARKQGHGRLADTILRDAGLPPAPA